MLEYAASALTAEGWSVATLNGRGTAEGKEENDRQQEKFKRDKSERESAKDGGEEDERVAEQQGRDPEILSSTPGLKPASYIFAVYIIICDPFDVTSTTIDDALCDLDDVCLPQAVVCFSYRWPIAAGPPVSPSLWHRCGDRQAARNSFVTVHSL